MSLNLDPRQRAMLLEMGVHVWLPDAPVAVPLVPALGSDAAQADVNADAASVGARRVAAGSHAEALAPSAARVPVQRDVSAFMSTPASTLTPARPAHAPTTASAGSSAFSGATQSARSETSGGVPGGATGSAPAAWLLGAAQILYADTAQAAGTPAAGVQAAGSQTAGTQTAGPRWLVLAETSPMALPGGVLADFSAFDGEAGKLLDNMLRAARLDRAGSALLAPLVRQGAAAATPQFVAELAALVAQTQPDIVLVMGRFASLSLLPTGEPFGKLRGQVRTLHGARAIVTYDAPYLLRKPEDKAKAWADLCLAMSLSAVP
jgi:DNA polymerase